MPIKCVLDTNIILSAMLSYSGYPAKIFDAVVEKEIKMYITKKIISEYKDVLSRDYFKISHEKIGRTINIIRKLSTVIIPEISSFPMKDESDRIFFDAAQNAEAWLVTGNIKHFPKKDFILTPAAFCRKFNF
jgi:putative PIN family toxin of toxin-antitoxin system